MGVARLLIFVGLACACTWLYVELWNTNPGLFVNPSHAFSSANGSNSGTQLNVGVNANVEVSVVRTYFGLFELPVYADGKDFGVMHEFFLWSMALMIVIPSLLEVREWQSVTSKTL